MPRFLLLFIVHRKFTMATVIEALQNEHNLSNIIQETLEDSELREKYGSDALVWHSIADALDSYKDRVPIYKLITNISACDQAGTLAFEAGVVSRLIKFANHDASPQLWRAVSNLNQTCPTDLSIAGIDYGKALNIATMPTLRLIEANVRKFPASIVTYANNGVLVALLSQVNDWYETNLAAFQITTNLFVSAIESEFAPTILDEIIGLGLIDRSVSLQKVFDAALSICVKRISEQTAHDLALVLGKHLKSIIEEVLPFFPDEKLRATKLASNYWTWLLANIESLLLVAIAARSELGAQDFGLVQKLVEILVASKQLPQHNKLGKGDHELDQADFPLVKSTVIPLLSIIVAQNRWAQDYLRESGGLLAILEACTVDENNPFVREKAIVCVRYLLHENDENQKFVGQLEAKKVVNPDVLEKAGYEAEIVNGQLSVKTAKVTEAE